MTRASCSRKLVIHGRDRSDFEVVDDVLDAGVFATRLSGGVLVGRTVDCSAERDHAVLHADGDGVEGVVP